MQHGAIPERDLGLARDAFNRGDLASAAPHIDRALKSHPDCAEAHFGKGMIATVQGRDADALASFAEAIRCNPNDAESLNRAAVVALKLERGDLAESYATRLARIRPEDPAPRLLRSNALWLLGRRHEAFEAIDRAIALAPRNGRLFAAKAKLLANTGQTSKAIELYRKSLHLEPGPDAGLELADLLMDEGLVEEAVSLVETYSPSDDVGRSADATVARLYTEARLFERAAPYWVSAGRAAKSRVELLQSRAPAEILAGRLEVAEALIREALAEDPSAYQFYRPLTSIVKISPRDAEVVDRMEKLWDENPSNPALRQDLSYALGKAYDDLGEYERAMTCFDEANRLAFERSSIQRRFNPSSWRAETDFQIDFFTKTRVEHLRRAGSDSEKPLFVLGMIRSGTTLAEQILSGHSRIKGGGEKTFWYDNRDAMLLRSSQVFDTGVAKRLGLRYLDEIRAGDVNCDRIVDKNPGNFYVAASLSCVFPRSKIVHMRRHPVDNLLSIWMTPITTGAPFVYRRDHLLFAYREYLRLARHWEAILPDHTYRTVSYEDLTSRPQETIEQLFHYVGLPVEERCFHPEANRRTVRTPSVYQVRQPINTDSQAKWRRYEPWLGVFAELLDEAER